MVERGTSPEQGFGPIQKWESPEIVEAADSFLRNGGEEADPDTAVDIRVESPTAAIAESESSPPWSAEELAAVLEPPTYAQQVWSSWFYESLCNRVQRDEREGKEISAHDIRECHRQFQLRELDEWTRTSVAEWESRGHDVDFSLVQVLERATDRPFRAAQGNDPKHTERQWSAFETRIQELLYQAVKEDTLSAQDGTQSL